MEPSTQDGKVGPSSVSCQNPALPINGGEAPIDRSEIMDEPSTSLARHHSDSSSPTKNATMGSPMGLPECKSPSVEDAQGSIAGKAGDGVDLRRSTRVRTARKFYDASTGK